MRIMDVRPAPGSAKVKASFRSITLVTAGLIAAHSLLASAAVRPADAPGRDIAHRSAPAAAGDAATAALGAHPVLIAQATSAPALNGGPGNPVLSGGQASGGLSGGLGAAGLSGGTGSVGLSGGSGGFGLSGGTGSVGLSGGTGSVGLSGGPGSVGLSGGRVALDGIGLPGGLPPLTARPTPLPGSLAPFGAGSSLPGLSGSAPGMTPARPGLSP